MTNWLFLITEAMERYGEGFSDILSCTFVGKEPLVEFDDGYGVIEGKPFTVWTNSRVYFPWCDDGGEGCGSVSRHPDGRATKHNGREL